MRSLSPEDPSTFELGDTVTFGGMTGTVVRVYANRTLFHVQVGNKRYMVDDTDNPIATRFALPICSCGSVETDH